MATPAITVTFHRASPKGLHDAQRLSYAALLLAGALPLQALADTDVYLTNNSPEPCN